MPRDFRVPLVDRDEFLASRWAYRAGEHVTILGPTDSGKTHLAYQLLARSATPRLPALVLVMKPRDPVVRDFTRDMGFTTTTAWPPPPHRLWWRKPPGYTVWPRHTFDPERDDQLLETVFRAAVTDSYKRGNRIIFADEMAGLVADLKMERQMNGVWTRGRTMGCGVWAASQRPAHIPQHAYNAASHLFLFHDPDARARDRYAEIGGIDPNEVKAVTANLPEYHCLYIRRKGQVRCVIGP